MEIDNELKEFLIPSKTALLVWDVQNMLVETIFNKDTFLANTKDTILLAREKKVPVIFSKITPLPEKFESPIRRYYFKKRLSLAKQVTNGLDLTIEPAKEDIIIPKNTASIFIGTNFERILRNAGIITMVFTGIATELGIESSARDAANRGFLSVIISDAVSSFNKEAHFRSLENLKNMMVVMNTEELISMWGE
jgi:nicotinamidase-related amidase